MGNGDADDPAAEGASPAAQSTLIGQAFFISGGRTDKDRTRSDYLFSAAIEVLKDRAPKVKLRHWRDSAAPGSITADIVRRIAEAPLVFADLTGSNPNVYYETGLAHAFGTPLISFIEEGETPAFDLSPDRVIPVQIGDDAEVNYEPQVRKQLNAAVLSLTRDPHFPRTAVDNYRQSVDNRRLQSEIAELRAQVKQLQEGSLALTREAGSRQRHEHDHYRWGAAAVQGRLRRVRVAELEAGLRIYDLDHGLGEVVRFRGVEDGRFLTVRFGPNVTDSLIVREGETELPYFLPPE